MNPEKSAGKFDRADKSAVPATREQWLMRAVDSLRPLFKQHGFEVPVNVKASCGFPSKGARSLRRRAIGQCWDAEASNAKVFEIFISPVISDHVKVLGVLAHEVVHATVGTKCGHKGAFKRCALAIGLTGKMTSTEEGETFKRFADDQLPTLGAYPHAELNLKSLTKKQGTRLIKCECSECGYTVRVTRMWIDTAGTPICPLDKIAMEAA